MNICPACGTVDAGPLYPVPVSRREGGEWTEAVVQHICERCVKAPPKGWRLG